MDTGPNASALRSRDYALLDFSSPACSTRESTRSVNSPTNTICLPLQNHRFDSALLRSAFDSRKEICQNSRSL
ncbi:hypothetical protein V2J09_004511 [Rumex salicifolius]